MMTAIDTMLMGKPLWMWLGFMTVVLGLLAFDLGLFQRTPHAIGVRESLIMSAIYIALALVFGGWVWLQLGPTAGQNYVTAYLVEKTLSLDNLFVISLIFAQLGIPAQSQHRVLFWGILGALVMRGVMIGLGAALIAQFHWILFVFAAFLIVTGIKMLFTDEKPVKISDSPVLNWLNKRFRVTSELHGEAFFVRQPGASGGKIKTWVTPLFLSLVLIEVIDLVFAVDSIPAVFSVTTDPFVVYTSNIFAILGLRALYFAISAVIGRFKYLKQALALVLIFIGSKVFLVPALGWTTFPAWLSLSVTIALLAGGIAYSMFRTRNDARTVLAE
jgi:tellurite resistance protein TerC